MLVLTLQQNNAIYLELGDGQRMVICRADLNDRRRLQIHAPANVKIKRIQRPSEIDLLKLREDHKCHDESRDKSSQE